MDQKIISYITIRKKWYSFVPMLQNILYVEELKYATEFGQNALKFEAFRYQITDLDQNSIQKRNM